MSLLSRLFGRKDAETTPSVVSEDYEGYRITPTPMKDGPAYRVSARIEKDFEGTPKAHNLIRADTIADQQEAAAASVRKAKQMIDQLGDRIFDM